MKVIVYVLLALKIVHALKCRTLSAALVSYHVAIMRMRTFRSKVADCTYGFQCRDLCNGAVSDKTPQIF